MTLLKGTTKLSMLVGMLSAAEVCAAAGGSHPILARGAGCVTPQCHARLLEAAAGARVGSAHQPAADGECVSCHDLELPSGASFVKGAPSGDVDGPAAARAWDLALCSGCHGEGLLAPNAPSAATGFADGNRNLHTLHAQAGRGRRCLPCHDPHASRQAKLLRERIPTRGKARIEQEFRSEPKGGWCKTGCHAPKSYKRSRE
jgi:predicted CXXCH cytochrome family protein